MVWEGATMLREGATILREGATILCEGATILCEGAIILMEGAKIGFVVANVDDMLVSFCICVWYDHCDHKTCTHYNRSHVSFF